MDIKDILEFSDQVFGGGGSRDLLNEVGSEGRRSSWMILPAASRRGVVKKVEL